MRPSSLDPEVTKLCLCGVASLTEEYYDTEVAAAFLHTAQCFDDNRAHGVFYLGAMQWLWHFERETSSAESQRGTKSACRSS